MPNCTAKALLWKLGMTTTYMCCKVNCRYGHTLHLHVTHISLFSHLILQWLSIAQLLLQANGHDCGIYVCLVAARLLLGRSITDGIEDGYMPRWRELIACELANLMHQAHGYQSKLMKFLYLRNTKRINLNSRPSRSSLLTS